MAITVGTIIKVVATMAWLDGNISQNVFSAVITGTGGPYDEADIVSDALDWVEAMFLDLVLYQSDEIDGSQVQVYEYDSVDDDYDELGTVSWVYNPTQTGDQLPRGVATLINCGTTDPDVQGKKYIAAATEANITDGLWLAVWLTKIALFADTWLTAFTGSTSGAAWQPGVWSPTNTNFYAANGNYTIPTIPAYQRRRKRGVGV